MLKRAASLFAGIRLIELSTEPETGTEGFSLPSLHSLLPELENVKSVTNLGGDDN